MSTLRSLSATGHRWLTFLNNLLLIPMFTIIVIETWAMGRAEHRLLFEFANFGFCVFFLLEWIWGLGLARDRLAYLRTPAHLIDLISSIPFGHAFQSLRAFRVLRALRLFRLMFRARRYEGPAARALRIWAAVLAIMLAGAVALRLTEPEVVPNFADAVWWAIVTMSTVGYGDLAPSTPLGRGIASLLMVFGIGAFSYTAGFMATIIEDPEEQEMLKVLARLEAKIDEVRQHLGIEDQGGAPVTILDEN